MESVLLMRVLMKETGILRNFFKKRMSHENICKELKEETVLKKKLKELEKHN